MTDVLPLPGQPADPACSFSAAEHLGLATSPDDTVHWTEQCRGASVINILNFGRARAAVAQAEQYVTSEDGREVYLFDTNGRHSATKDARTGATLNAFGYAQYGEGDVAGGAPEELRAGGLRGREPEA